MVSDIGTYRAVKAARDGWVEALDIAGYVRLVDRAGFCLWLTVVMSWKRFAGIAIAALSVSLGSRSRTLPDM